MSVITGKDVMQLRQRLETAQQKAARASGRREAAAEEVASLKKELKKQGFEDNVFDVAEQIKLLGEVLAEEVEALETSVSGL